MPCQFYRRKSLHARAMSTLVVWTVRLGVFPCDEISFVVTMSVSGVGQLTKERCTKRRTVNSEQSPEIKPAVNNDNAEFDPVTPRS